MPIAALHRAPVKHQKLLTRPTTDKNLGLLGPSHREEPSACRAPPGVLVGSASLVALKTRTLPKWLAIAGFVVAFLGFVTIFTYGLSLALEAIWLPAVSAIMATGKPVGEPVQRAALGTA